MLQKIKTYNVVEDKNIGIEEAPKIVKLSKNLPVKEKEEYTNLMKNYIDVFAWSYEDLKEYDTSIIQHTISIKPGEKPFKQKLRRINPMLLPVIEKLGMRYGICLVTISQSTRLE